MIDFKEDCQVWCISFFYQNTGSELNVNEVLAQK